MKHILWLFILLFLAIWLGIQLNHDPGYLLIAFNHVTIETPLWFGLILLIAGFCLLHGLLLIYHRLCRLPAKFKHWLSKRRQAKACAKTNQGLIEFGEGNWLPASHHLMQGLPEADTPLINYLMAARAAQESGNFLLRDEYLTQAQEAIPEAKIAIELTQAQLQLANHQWEQALVTLRSLHNTAPNHRYVLQLLVHLYREMGEWRQLITLLPQLKKQALSQDEFTKLQHEAYLNALAALIKTDDNQAINQLMDNLPKTLKQDAEIIAVYSQYLINTNEHELAEKILRTCLHKQYHDKLITIYSLIHLNKSQLKFAETFLKKHSDSAALLLSLGRLSLANQLWGKAKNYIAQSLNIAASTETYALMAELHEHFNEHEQAFDCYRQGLLLAVTRVY